MLKFECVKKHYEDFELDLTLEVPEGYVTGLIGANGAGKSTAFKAALGLIRPDAGVVKMLGKNVEDFTVQDKEWIGVVLADSGFSGYLRVKDILPMLESMYHKFQKEDFLEMWRGTFAFTSTSCSMSAVGCSLMVPRSVVSFTSGPYA